jgi:hypothetical protein
MRFSSPPICDPFSAHQIHLDLIIIIIIINSKDFSLCLTKHHAMKAYWGSRSIPPCILTSALDGGECSALHPAALPPGKDPRYPLNRRQDGPQSRSGRGEEKNSQSLPRLEPPINQPVAQRYTGNLQYSGGI